MIPNHLPGEIRFFDVFTDLRKNKTRGKSRDAKEGKHTRSQRELGALVPTSWSQENAVAPGRSVGRSVVGWLIGWLVRLFARSLVCRTSMAMFHDAPASTPTPTKRGRTVRGDGERSFSRNDPLAMRRRMVRATAAAVSSVKKTPRNDPTTMKTFADVLANEHRIALVNDITWRRTMNDDFDDNDDDDDSGGDGETTAGRMRLLTQRNQRSTLARSTDEALL